MAAMPLQTMGLGRAASLELLRSSRVGRVLFTDGALPVALPVFYAMDPHDHVVFRTRPDSQLARKAHDWIVGFEADYVDEPTASGWSVHATGPASRLHHADLRHARSLPLPTWPGDDRTAFFRIELTHVFGRHVPVRIPVHGPRAVGPRSAD
jgi:hypothetical protein